MGTMLSSAAGVFLPLTTSGGAGYSFAPRAKERTPPGVAKDSDR